MFMMLFLDQDGYHGYWTGRSINRRLLKVEVRRVALTASQRPCDFG